MNYMYTKLGCLGKKIKKNSFKYYLWITDIQKLLNQITKISFLYSLLILKDIKCHGNTNSVNFQRNRFNLLQISSFTVVYFPINAILLFVYMLLS